MLSSGLVAGAEYAFREKRISGSLLQRIRLLERVRGSKWKAKWIDPHPGLTDYISTSQIIAPWKEHKRFLREESDIAALNEYNKAHGYDRDSPLASAIEQVFDSVGDGVYFRRGILYGEPERLNRVRMRAGMPAFVCSSPSFADCEGRFRLPFDEALELARNFCMAEPAAVLLEAEATERKWSLRATRPGEEYIIPLLNDYRASWALIRQWTGSDAALATRDQHIAMLERLVWDAIYALQKAGLEKEAKKLRSVIGNV